MFDLNHLSILKKGQSRSINWENRKGEKGMGGRAASDLGTARKGSPCIPEIKSGETVTLAEMDGPGTINHIWITVTDRTSERQQICFKKIWFCGCTGMERKSLQWKVRWEIFLLRFGVSYCVNSLPVAVNPTRGFNSYFPNAFPKKS